MSCLLEYKLMYRGLLFLADQPQTDSYWMVWGLMLEGTVKQWLEVPLLNIGFQFLIQRVSIVHHKYGHWTAYSSVHLKSQKYYRDNIK